MNQVILNLVARRVVPSRSEVAEGPRIVQLDLDFRSFLRIKCNQVQGVSDFSLSLEI